MVRCWTINLVFYMDEIKVSKKDAILEAIRCMDVGNEVVILNNDGSVWCILKMICREHPEQGE